tara:strand:- start:12487 stop:13197 length:711 start_codon:yes stop_codon:yes gene_type:complete
MNKKDIRISRSDEDLTESIITSLRLFHEECALFDNGNLARFITLANHLRRILHNTNHCKSDVEHLCKIAERKTTALIFLDTAIPYNTSCLNGNCRLTTTYQYAQVTAQNGNLTGLAQIPHCLHPNPNKHLKTSLIPFEHWWSKNEIINSQDKSLCFTRKELVTHIADTDGGAHHDNGLIKKYYTITREQKLSNMDTSFLINNKQFPKSETQMAIRQIAHECLISLKQNFPILLKDV